MIVWNEAGMFRVNTVEVRRAFRTRFDKTLAGAILLVLLFAGEYGGAQISIPRRGQIGTVAGNGVGEPGYSGDGVQATNTKLNNPTGVAVDLRGNLYIADKYNNRIRKVDAASGTISTVAGTGIRGASGDGGAATNARLFYPNDLAVDSVGNLYIVDSFNNNRIRKVDASSGTITTIAGNGLYGNEGDGGPATNARLNYPMGVAVDWMGNFYIADTGNSAIRKVDKTGTISRVTWKGSEKLYYPYGVAADWMGNLYIADTLNNRVMKVDVLGNMSTVAGNGTAGYSGDGGPATGAELNFPTKVAVDWMGNVYIADTGNDLVRKVSRSGIIKTIAGTGDLGYSGDGGPATKAELNGPTSIALDWMGNVYIADLQNQRVRVVGNFNLR